MIILSWNIRDLGSGLKRREVRNLVRRFKCDVLILCETKLEFRSPPLLRNIGGGRLSQWEMLSFYEASGGILIGWDDQVVSFVDS